MADYLDLELAADPEELRQNGVDWLQANAGPGYVVRGLVLWLLGAVARMAAEVVVLAGQVPRTIFRVYGQEVLGISALDATAATGTVTVTAVDTLGHTLLAGAQLLIDDVAFTTVSDLTIGVGDTTGTVNVTAAEPGSTGTGLPGDEVLLISPTAIWVDSTTLVAPTAGGLDGETDDEYNDRLADELVTLSPKAVLIEDFEALARRDIEVARALAIDNLVPPSTTGVEGAVTIALQDANGDPVSGAAKTRVKDALEAGRVLALDVHVIDPTYTDIDVSFTAEAYPDQDPVAMQSAAEAAVTEFLSPQNWGLPPGGDQDTWLDEPLVRRNDLMGVLYAAGLRHVSALTLAIDGNALGTADLTLTGPAGLPRPSTIIGTVT